MKTTLWKGQIQSFYDFSICVESSFTNIMLIILFCGKITSFFRVLIGNKRYIRYARSKITRILRYSHISCVFAEFLERNTEFYLKTKDGIYCFIIFLIYVYIIKCSPANLMKFHQWSRKTIWKSCILNFMLIFKLLFKTKPY